MKRTLLVIFSIISVIVFFYYQFTRTQKVTHGFASYYTFSRLLAEEESFARAYDTAYFNTKIAEYGIENVRDLPNNTPASSLMFLPLAYFSRETAKIIGII